MTVVALALAILWFFSLWLLLAEQNRPRGTLFPRALAPLGILSGTVLFFLLGLSSLLFLRLLISE